MCKSKSLQMCSFSIILTSLRSLNLSFPLLSYVISTATPKFLPWFSTSPSWFPPFSLWFKNEHYPLLLLHDLRHQIIAFIIWDVISDITKKLPESA